MSPAVGPARPAQADCRCGTLQNHIQNLKDGPYITARSEVDALRDELEEPVQAPEDLQSQIDKLLASSVAVSTTSELSTDATRSQIITTSS